MRDTWATERVVAELAGANDGIVDDGVARRAGLTHQARTRLRARGVLVKLGDGVDRLRDHPFDFRSRCRAALALAGTGAVLGLRTAARLLGCWAYRDREEIEVLVVRGRDHRTTVGRIVETRWLPPEHVTVRAGLPVTTIGRTFFDLCGDPDRGLSLRHPVHERRMKQLYNDCLGRRGMSFTTAVMVLSVLARRGRRGTVLVRRLLAHFGAEHEATRSDVEALMWELIRSRSLPEPVPQGVIVGDQGWIATVDFVWWRQKHVVEVDSSWHDGPLDVAADRQRDEDLRAAGYRVDRYRFRDIVLEPDRVARELAAALTGEPVDAAAGTRVRGAR